MNGSNTRRTGPENENDEHEELQVMSFHLLVWPSGKEREALS